MAEEPEEFKVQLALKNMFLRGFVLDGSDLQYSASWRVTAGSEGD